MKVATAGTWDLQDYGQVKIFGEFDVSTVPDNVGTVAFSTQRPINNRLWDVGDGGLFYVNNPDDGIHFYSTTVGLPIHMYNSTSATIEIRKENILIESGGDVTMDGGVLKMWASGDTTPRTAFTDTAAGGTLTMNNWATLRTVGIDDNDWYCYLGMKVVQNGSSSRRVADDYVSDGSQGHDPTLEVSGDYTLNSGTIVEDITWTFPAPGGINPVVSYLVVDGAGGMTFGTGSAFITNTYGTVQPGYQVAVIDAINGFNNTDFASITWDVAGYTGHTKGSRYWSLDT